MLKELGFSVADWLKNPRKILHNQLALAKFEYFWDTWKNMSIVQNNREKRGRESISPEDEVALVW